MYLSKEKTKALFLEGINAVQKQIEMNERIDNALNTICDGYPVFTGTCDIETSYLKVIGNLFPNPDSAVDFICWLIYDGGGEVEINETEKVMIDTPEALFEFLYTEAENEKNN